MADKLTPEQVDTLEKNQKLILEAHGEVVKAKRKAFKTYLEHAIEAGEMLNANKKIVGHGNFEKWVNASFDKDDLSYRTARDYMKCATNKDKLEALDKPARSIREALWLIKTPEERKAAADRLAKARAARGTTTAPTKSTPTTQGAPASGGLKAELENAAADEIVSLLKKDEEKLQDLASKLPVSSLQSRLKEIKANDLFLMLKKAWPDDERDELARLIGKDVEETDEDQPSSPPPPQPEQPQDIRRN